MGEPVWRDGVVGYISRATRKLLFSQDSTGARIQIFPVSGLYIRALNFLLNLPLKLVRSPNPFTAEATDFSQRKTEGEELKNPKAEIRRFLRHYPCLGVGVSGWVCVCVGGAFGI